MKQYLDLLRELVESGNAKDDRTKTGTLSVFGRQMRFNLEEGFPLLTTKKMFFRGIAEELLWFLSGSTNIKPLQEKGITIWDSWANKKGEVGPLYGKQMRKWAAVEEVLDSESDQTWWVHEIDQIAEVIRELKLNPNSRRHIVTTWNPADIDDMALPPCHGNIIQFYVYDGKLSCQMYQRSADTFLGLPFNIASYALLTHMIAQQCNLDVGDLIITTGDTHLYQNHIEQAKLQLQREIFRYPLPTLIINRKPASIDDYKFEDFTLVNYLHHPAIKAPISV